MFEGENSAESFEKFFNIWNQIQFLIIDYPP